ncbi:hypothetical protein [Corynebacterium frankenforstense]
MKKKPQDSDLTEESLPDDLKTAEIVDALIWIPGWNAHSMHFVESGDSVPVEYSRHASVHAISPVQYTKINCLRALMNVTSLGAYVADGKFQLDMSEMGA